MHGIVPGMDASLARGNCLFAPYSVFSIVIEVLPKERISHIIMSYHCFNYQQHGFC